MNVDRLQRVEEALRLSLEEARSRGLRLVTNAFNVYADNERKALIGVCAMGALSEIAKHDVNLNLEPGEYVSIEDGWDGLCASSCRPEWHALGQRLAAEFKPVPAATLGGVS